MATSAVASMIPMSTGPRSERKPTPGCCVLTGARLGQLTARRALGPAVLLADLLEERVQVRGRAVGPPGELHRDGRRVPDRAVDDAVTAVLCRGGLRGDAHGLAGRDHREPVLHAADRLGVGGSAGG